MEIRAGRGDLVQDCPLGQQRAVNTRVAGDRNISFLQDGNCFNPQDRPAEECRMQSGKPELKSGAYESQARVNEQSLQDIDRDHRLRLPMQIF